MGKKFWKKEQKDEQSKENVNTQQDVIKDDKVEQEEVVNQKEVIKEEVKEDKQEDKANMYFEQLVRLQADFENFRKRCEKEKPLLIEYGKREVIKALLPLYDNLSKAKGEFEKDKIEVAQLKQGLKMILSEVDKSFKAQGVKVISSIGKPYDPMTQEVITTLPCQPEQDGLVLQELAQGVELDGKMLRPAQVIVGKAQETETSTTQVEEEKENPSSESKEDSKEVKKENK